MATLEAFRPSPSTKRGFGPLEYRTQGRSLLSSSAWAYLCMALRLSPREMQIVQAVFDDWTEENIAFELGISSHTVNTYFRRLYTKLRVSSRPQLILRVIEEYLTLLASNSPPLARVACAGDS